MQPVMSVRFAGFGTAARPSVETRAAPSPRCLPRSRRRVMMAAHGAPMPPLPGPGLPPPSRTYFFESVTRKLGAIARKAPSDSPSGAWAARFNAALQAYAGAQRAWEDIRYGGSEATGREKVARVRAAQKLDIAWRIGERAPADIAASLGTLPSGDTGPDEPVPAIETWLGLCRALSLARLMLDAELGAPPTLANASAADPLASLDHLRELLRNIGERRIDLQDVATWHVKMTDALANLDAAEARLAQQGPGYGGVNVFNALGCCEHLLAEVQHLPMSPHTFTRPHDSFEASQLWLDEAGAYQHGIKHAGSKEQRVLDYLRLRCRDLQEQAVPWDASAVG